MRFVIFATVMALMMGGCSYMNKKLGLSDDNLIEESAEALLERQLGVDVDLTPCSPE